VKAAEAAREILSQVTELTEMPTSAQDIIARLHALRSRLVEPLHRFLVQRPQFAQAAQELMALLRAVEEYVLCYEAEPDKRSPRRAEIERLKVLLRRSLLPQGDKELEVQELLADVRRWQWRMRVDEDGRIVFATPAGASMPAKGEIAQKVGPEVIEQATRAQRPYSDAARPRDKRGEPGGLVRVRGAKRLIVVGDLHGRYDNLESILRDRDNLASIIAGETHLVFTGDAVHPPSSLYNDDAAYEDSFAVMLLIMTLKAENPDTIHYIIGNHDNSHVGGEMAGRGEVRQNEAFERFITKKFGPGVLARYKEFVARAPVAVKVNLGSAHLLLVHATVPRNVRHDSALTDIFIWGRKSKMMQEILWSRQYSDEVLDHVREGMGVRLVVSGHTTPSPAHMARYGLEIIEPPVFAHYHNWHLIVNAQNNTFGYLHLDLTQEMPEQVTQLRAPGGRSAFRIIRRRGATPISLQG